MRKGQIIQTIIQRIIQHYEPEKIILFGSEARGEGDHAKDIDIIVIKDTPERFLQRLKTVALLCKDIDEAIDVLVYTPEEYRLLHSRYNPFFNNIRKEGKLLYEKQAKAYAPRVAG